MQGLRQQKVAEEIRKAAGEFIAAEANRNALITPTRVDISPDLKNAAVYVTVLPEQHEEEAVNFLRRKRSEFKSYLKKRHFKRLPQTDFKIDYGEKNRQSLDGINIGEEISED